MEKLIPRPIHAAIDYAYAAVVASAPETIGFKENKTATALCRGVAGGVAVYSLLTRYELGAVPVIPFKAHLTADVIGGFFAMSAPYVFGFSGNRAARNTFLAAGAFSVAAGLLTRPEEMTRSAEKG